MKGPGASLQGRCHVKAFSRRFAGMQHVPAFAIVGIAVQFLVAGHAPHVGGDAIFFFQDSLGLQHFVHNSAAAEQLHPQFFAPKASEVLKR